jgi:hypothetical protein
MSLTKVLCTLALLPAWFLAAQEKMSADNVPPSTAEVMRFYEVIHVHQQMQTMMDTQQKQVRIETDDLFGRLLPEATDNQRKQLTEIAGSTVSNMFKDYPIDNILREMVPVYQKHLSQSDLNALVAFYSTSVRQRIRHEMPAMTTEAMGVAYTHIQPRIEQVIKEM